MIIRKSTAKARQLRFGQSGDVLEALPEDFGAFLLGLPKNLYVPISSLPLRQRNLARVGIFASSRVVDGFSWHNTCLELTPANWQVIIERTRPDYLLVESCFYDSARAWPLLPFGSVNLLRIYKIIGQSARKAGVPSIFWYTLGPDLLPYFIDALSAFDIIACAEEVSCEILKKKNLEPRLLPYAFSPEQFNPLTNPRLESKSDALIFDGIASMMRFPDIRLKLRYFADLDLTIIDTGLITPDYNLQRFYERDLAAKVVGNISQTRVQDVYKNSGGYLSIDEGLSPASQWRSLEAAACRLPVLHIGSTGSFIDQFSKNFKNPVEATEYWQELCRRPLEREREAHLAWRKTHQKHTFANRMAQIHQWLNLAGDPFPILKAGIITPSIRKDNFNFALSQYEMQNWPNKEFVYIFNGATQEMPSPQLGRKDIKIILIPSEYAAGMVMNAGIMTSNADVLFRLDDDDLYGASYVADRMIYFREFNIDSMTNARTWLTFGESGLASIATPDIIPQDNTVFALGSATYQVMTFPGATWAMRKDFARHLGFMGAANAWADVAFLLKGMFFASDSAHIKTDAFNFCVRRNDPQKHTWSASREELKKYMKNSETPLADIFI